MKEVADIAWIPIFSKRGICTLSKVDRRQMANLTGVGSPWASQKTVSEYCTSIAIVRNARIFARRRNGPRSASRIWKHRSDVMVKQSKHTQTKQRVKVNDRFERFLESRLTAAEKAYEWFVKSRWMSPYRSGDEDQAQYPERWQEYYDDNGLWGIDKADDYSAIDECLDNDDPVLILGATGTGKELVCDAIHNHSNRKHETLIKVNSAGLSTELLSSELFGHVKGAFTGANHNRIGAIEKADKGTVFLDEIGDLTGEAQKKLLRYLQDGSVEKVGEAGSPKKFDVRVIAATNKEIDKLECRGSLKFRHDLFYRLCGIPIRLAPLRSSLAAIAYLSARFLVEANQGQKDRIPCLSFDFMVNLLLYDWPGNVRQLEHALRFVFRRVRRKLIKYKKVKEFIRHEKLPSTGSEYLRSCMMEYSNAFFDYIGFEERARLEAKTEATIVPRLTFGHECYKGVPLSLDIVCSLILVVPFSSASAGHSVPPSIVYIGLLANEIDRNETFRNLAPRYSKFLRPNAHRRRARPSPETQSDSISVPFKEAIENFKVNYFYGLFEEHPDAKNTEIVHMTGADPGTVAKYRGDWRKKNSGK